MPAHSDPRATPRGELPDRYLKPEFVAELLDVPVETLYQWRKKRTGPPGFRVGRHTRYDPADVYNWIAEQKRKDISQAA
ncbi:helix-turn-helix transcriptional regulator [Streptomyces sp. IGB124]|uniref:helix-turn-helix transcriptional regulator n=1 Tax=Streptomyces sp. IGB124 TaxID=1519485 RepID=UPI0006AEEF2F|nr:helix-turn-helix domain-containing protein [Streptomyces sp. IGB124]KOU62348.1 DNA-binding protein [Streptomyces sp. IGB124]